MQAKRNEGSNLVAKLDLLRFYQNNLPSFMTSSSTRVINPVCPCPTCLSKPGVRRMSTRVRAHQKKKDFGE